MSQENPKKVSKPKVTLPDKLSEAHLTEPLRKKKKTKERNTNH